MYLHERYLSGKARKDRWYWNNSIQRGRSTAVRENWQWKPAVAYCRYADDFVLIVKGTKAQAEAIREECRGVLEGSLKLRLNMDKTKITHVNDGFIFLGHRIIRKRSRYGEMRVVSTIPQEKARNFAASLTALLSGNYSESKVNRPGFPGECFICELRLPDHRFRWKHNKLFLLLPEEYGPAFPAIVDCYTSPPT